MEPLFSFLAGLMLAGIGAFFILRSVKSNALAAQTKALEDAAKQAEVEKKAEVARLEADLANAKDNLERAKLDAATHTQQLLEAKEKANKEAIQAIEKNHADAIEAMEKRHAEAIKAEERRFEEKLAHSEERIQNVSNKILKAQQEDMLQKNSTTMNDIVNPLKEKIKEMETALKESKSTQETSTEAIKEKIATLVSTTMKVSTSAERLSNALTAENKIQGNWGEQKIETLLNNLGLEEGLEYDSQEFLRDANGNIIVSDETAHRMQPDIIIHLDETRDVIVDSKVSLNAFVDYTNTDDEQKKSIALAAHLKSVRAHVKELAKKNYPAYVKAPRQSVNFVMMFVPVEAALQLAFNSDPTLFRDAMDQGVFIVGEQNLYAVLRTVQETWTAIKQNANNKAICDAAEELLGRVGDLLERVQKMGKKLGEVNSAYEGVCDKATKGQSVLGSARKLVRLGAKVSSVHPLPQYDPEEDFSPSELILEPETDTNH